MRGIHRSPVNSPHKGQWRGALMFSLINTLVNSWENNREAGDFRCHRAHCDVIVMCNFSRIQFNWSVIYADCNKLCSNKHARTIFYHCILYEYWTDVVPSDQIVYREHWNKNIFFRDIYVCIKWSLEFVFCWNRRCIPYLSMLECQDSLHQNHCCFNR